MSVMGVKYVDGFQVKLGPYEYVSEYKAAVNEMIRAGHHVGDYPPGHPEYDKSLKHYIDYGSGRK